VQRADFYKLWGGQTISELGSAITYNGLPLLAVITLNATPVQLGLLTAAGSVPVILFGLVAGVWVDRLRRRPVMIAADLGRAAVLVSLPIAALLGVLHAGQLYWVAALAGALGVFFNAAYRAYLPTLVSREALVASNSRLTLSSSVVEIVGPGLAGALVQAITAPLAILFDSLSYLVSAVSLAIIRQPEPPPPPPGGYQSAFKEAVEGFSLVMHHPVLRALALQGVVGNFFGSFFAVLYALYVIRVLHLTPIALGVAIGVGGVSSVFGSLFAEQAARRFGLGVTLIAGLLIGDLFTVLGPLAASVGGLGFAFLIISQASDIAGTIYNIHATSLRQSIPPERMLGRVIASTDLLVTGIGPVGALVGGLLGARFGPQVALSIAVAGFFLSSLIVIASPIRKLKSGVEIGETLETP
jgi:MFS family permease